MVYTIAMEINQTITYNIGLIIQSPGDSRITSITPRHGLKKYIKRPVKRRYVEIIIETIIFHRVGLKSII